MRRVLVTGSRDWADRLTVWNALNSELLHFPTGIVVVHGLARGLDTIADEWATSMHMTGWPVRPERHAVPPGDWERIGKAAGNVRNQRMVDLGADVCHGFPLPSGTGTQDCMKRAANAGIPVIDHG